MTIIAFNRYWVVRWPWVLANLIVVALLLGLSFWQWQRAAAKLNTMARVAHWQQQCELGSAQLIALASNERDAVQVNFPARWLAPMVWLVDNQMVDGRIGYDVLIAVQEISAVPGMDTAPKKSSAMLVNLGWVPAPPQRSQLPKVAVPEQLQIQGIFRTRVKGLLLGENMENKNGWPMRIQQFDPDSLLAYVPAPLLPGVIYQQKNSPFVVHYRSVVLLPERHHAYALQWFLLALAVIVIALAASAHKVVPEENA